MMQNKKILNQWHFLERKGEVQNCLIYSYEIKWHTHLQSSYEHTNNNNNMGSTIKK